MALTTALLNCFLGWVTGCPKSVHVDAELSQVPSLAESADRHLSGNFREPISGDRASHILYYDSSLQQP